VEFRNAQRYHTSSTKQQQTWLGLGLPNITFRILHSVFLVLQIREKVG